MYPQALIEFTFFGKEIGIYLYGICIAIGLVACISVFYIYSKKAGVHEDIRDFVFFVAVIAIAIGFLSAKFFQALYDYLSSGVWDFMGAGLTVMGGLVGGVATGVALYFIAGAVLFKKRDNMHIKQVNDIFRVLPCCVTIAHAFGRLGCLFAGCCYGRVAEDGHGILIRGVARVPVQLYESLFLFALFIVLSILFFKKFNLTHVVYLIAYGIWRIVIEIFRADYRGGVDGALLTPSQWQSCGFIALGLAVLVVFIIIKVPIFVKKKEESVITEQTKEITE